MADESLEPALAAAVDVFKTWWKSQQAASAATDEVKTPVFHYTNANGLLGIVRNQEFWFTNAFHLNDPSELAYGIEIALELLHQESIAGDNIIKTFCERFESALVNHVGTSFGFYFASFSNAQDDLGQWRAHADDGRGFSIGLAPGLFRVNEIPDAKPNEITFVAKVIYDPSVAKANQNTAIRLAINTIKEQLAAKAIGSQNQLRLFLIDMSTALAIPIIWNAITTKHLAYSNEAETRLLIVNDVEKLAPHVETRTRGSSLIPFVRSPMPVRTSNNISSIMVGPAANSDAEDALRVFFRSQGISDETKILRSRVPYRSN